jgi:beta-glucosidase
LKRRVGANLSYEKGTSIAFAEGDSIERALKAAQEADTIVLVLADSSSSYADLRWGDENSTGKPVTTCGEGFDMHTLRFPGVQQDLFERVATVGKPLVLLLMTGRPYALTEADRLASAIIQVWYPGQEGGEAVARLLFGEENPSGRTPISFPRSVGHIPCYYNHKVSAMGYYHHPGSYEAPGQDYVFSEVGALYPFGHGLSYTSFEYTDLSVRHTGDTTFEASVIVRNTGDLAGAEVVMLFIRDLVCRITPFIRQLRGFRRVFLQPGESAHIVFPICFDDLSFINEQMKPEVEPGEFEAQVGGLSTVFEVKASRSQRFNI